MNECYAVCRCLLPVDINAAVVDITAVDASLANNIDTMLLSAAAAANIDAPAAADITASAVACCCRVRVATGAGGGARQFHTRV